MNRPGEVPEDKKVPGSPSDFAHPVSYTDGLKVEVVKTEQGRITDTGVGALTGQPVTTFTLKFVNGSNKSIDLNEVVVTATYGATYLHAPPIYTNGLNDFAGAIAPGETKQTAYAFSIPLPHLSKTTLWVDFDGLHTAAIFSGRVK